MIKAEPVRNLTRNTHNYFAQGGNELVIGGSSPFLPGCDHLKAATTVYAFAAPLIRSHMYLTARRLPFAALKDDYNALLAAIRNAGLMESAPSS